MAVVATHMIDTSAQARMSHPVVSAALSPLIGSGLVATCAPLDFEALYSSRTPEEYEQTKYDRSLAYEYLPTAEDDWQRALDVQRALARSSRVRAVGLPDLLIAAVAERQKVVVLHYDSDFDVIAEITRQSTVWVAPRGTVR
jgi:predicted nucleic acid-binding protein